MSENIDEKIADLEMRLAFQDETVEVLNRVVARLQEEVALQKEMLQLLYRKISENPADASFRQPEDEIPPHY